MLRPACLGLGKVGGRSGWMGSVDGLRTARERRWGARRQPTACHSVTARPSDTSSTTHPHSRTSATELFLGVPSTCAQTDRAGGQQRGSSWRVGGTGRAMPTPAPAGSSELASMTFPLPSRHPSDPGQAHLVDEIIHSACV